MTASAIQNQLTEEDILETKPELMVKLLATIGEDNNPNLVLVVSLGAKDNKTIMFAEFIYGKTKKNLEINPKCSAGFMSLGNDWIVLKGDFLKYIYEGDDYEYYNQKSLFKNNAYLSVTRVGYIAVKEAIAKRKIKFNRKLLRGIKGFMQEENTTSSPKLPFFVEKIFRAPSNLKYIAYIDTDGYPLIVPTMHLLPANDQLIFVPDQFEEDLTNLKPGTVIAAFAMNIEDLLMYQIKGTFQGYQKSEDLALGLINIEEVYCLMPPKAGDRIF